MKNLRADFPILKQTVHGKPLIYFDNAATTHKPQIVLDAMIQFYTTYNANIHRAIHMFGEQATDRYEAARNQVATFINACNSQEIVFTHGTTDGINRVAACWADAHISFGDEIVVSALEHHSNLVPWQQLAQKKGALLKYIPVKPDGMLDLTVLPTLFTAKTKFVAVTHVSNVLGTVVDIASIIVAAHAVGAKVLIDAAQSVGHIKIDVRCLGADFVVFSGHKIMGPTGIGVLYIAHELHDQLLPYQYGGGMVYQVQAATASWRSMPALLEAGTPAIAQAIGLGAALEYSRTHIDCTSLQQHEAGLCAHLIEGLSGIDRVRVLGPIEQLKVSGHLVSFVIEGIHAHDVAAYLDLQGICVRAGHHCAQPLAQVLGIESSVRVSFYCYNTESEVDTLIKAIQDLCLFF